jgi:hypothetical protein
LFLLRFASGRDLDIPKKYSAAGIMKQKGIKKPQLVLGFFMIIN